MKIQMRRRRKIPPHLRDIQAEVSEREMYHIRGRYRQMLSFETILRAVWHKGVYPKLRTACQLKGARGG